MKVDPVPPEATPPDGPALTWRLLSFDELTPQLLYAVLRLRQEVFVVEQACAYLDADGQDEHAWHLLGSSSVEPSTLIAYARILPPDEAYAEPRIGRIVTHAATRHRGLGHLLVATAIERTQARFPHSPIRIGAQSHLAPFYERHGFVVCGPHYDEDGIDHVPMLRPANVLKT